MATTPPPEQFITQFQVSLHYQFTGNCSSCPYPEFQVAGEEDSGQSWEMPLVLHQF